MDKKNLPIEGKLLTPWEIHFYTLVGKIYYWINLILPRKRRKTQNRMLSDNEFHQSIRVNPHNQNHNVNLKLDTINDISGGEIAKNVEITRHILETPLNSRIIGTAKNGAPLIMLGDGSKPRVMITAGVHGNELPPQIAALKIVSDLQRVDLQGTVYIIPFIAPKASAENCKLSEGENLNLVADVAGSPTNIVFNMARKLEITSLADCHATSTHPAEDSVIYYPSIGSSKIAVYVNKKAKSRLLALIKSKGTLIALCNRNKIPSIICEAESTDGIASNESIEVSYNQMKAFLEYNHIL